MLSDIMTSKDDFFREHVCNICYLMDYDVNPRAQKPMINYCLPGVFTDIIEQAPGTLDPGKERRDELSLSNFLYLPAVY